MEGWKAWKAWKAWKNKCSAQNKCSVQLNIRRKNMEGMEGEMEARILCQPQPAVGAAGKNTVYCIELCNK